MALGIPSARGERRILALDQLPVIIGRSSEAEIQVEDYWVSQYHCRIDRVGGAVEIRDLGSRTGTFVNGFRVTRAQLEPGDQVTLGRTKLWAWRKPVY